MRPGNIRDSVAGVGIDPSFFGGFTDISDYNNQNNSDADSAQSTVRLGSHLQLNATGGASLARRTTTTSSVSDRRAHGAGHLQRFKRCNHSYPRPDLQRRQTNSVYASADVTLNSWWTVGGTARNDWSSTLPKGNNSYFYPSASTSFVVTDAIPGLKNRFLSYLKLRASTAKVGADADPYLLRTTYTGLEHQVRRSFAVYAW